MCSHLEDLKSFVAVVVDGLHCNLPGRWFGERQRLGSVQGVPGFGVDFTTQSLLEGVEWVGGSAGGEVGVARRITYTSRT